MAFVETAAIVFLLAGILVELVIPKFFLRSGRKPVVLVWGLLSAMIFFGFVASSVLKGKDPFAPGATITQPSAMKATPAQSAQQPKHSHKAAQTPSQ